MVSVESSVKPSVARIVAFSGSAKRPSRTRILVEALGAELGRLRGIDLAVYDLMDAGPGLGATQRVLFPPAVPPLTPGNPSRGRHSWTSLI